GSAGRVQRVRQALRRCRGLLSGGRVRPASEEECGEAHRPDPEPARRGDRARRQRRNRRGLDRAALKLQTTGARSARETSRALPTGDASTVLRLLRRRVPVQTVAISGPGERVSGRQPLEVHDLAPDVRVAQEEYQRLLGYPPGRVLED